MTQNLNSVLTSASFTLEPLEDQSFAGYTTSQTWNGWACPLFTQPQAEAIVMAWQAEGFKADYDAATDMYRFAPFDRDADPDPDLSDEEAVEHFDAVEVEGQKLYRVGAGAWIWEVAA